MNERLPVQISPSVPLMARRVKMYSDITVLIQNINLSYNIFVSTHGVGAQQQVQIWKLDLVLPLKSWKWCLTTYYKIMVFHTFWSMWWKVSSEKSFTCERFAAVRTRMIVWCSVNMMVQRLWGRVFVHTLRTLVVPETHIIYHEIMPEHNTRFDVWTRHVYETLVPWSVATKSKTTFVWIKVMVKVKTLLALSFERDSLVACQIWSFCPLIFKSYDRVKFFCHGIINRESHRKTINTRCPKIALCGASKL